MFYCISWDIAGCKLRGSFKTAISTATPITSALRILNLFYQVLRFRAHTYIVCATHTISGAANTQLYQVTRKGRRENLGSNSRRVRFDGNKHVVVETGKNSVLRERSPIHGSRVRDAEEAESRPTHWYMTSRSISTDRALVALFVDSFFFSLRVLTDGSQIPLAKSRSVTKIR